MNYVFVRFVENGIHCIVLVCGKAAESRESFIDSLSCGDSVEILDWFEVPESWENAVVGGALNDAFESLLALDDLGDTPVVSDLFATIFEAGYRLAESKKKAD